MSLFIHGCVNLCDVMRCGTLSSMIRWHPLLKNVQTSFMLLHVVKLLITVSDRSLHISLIFSMSALPHMKIFRFAGLCRVAVMLELM